MNQRIWPRERSRCLYASRPTQCKPLIWWAQRIPAQAAAPYQYVIFRTPVTALAFSLQIEHLPVGLRHHDILVGRLDI
jgi:hypothetical protein